MTPWLDDGDVVLHHGDALEQLRLMPSESVHCIVTSPPFWGLRSYIDDAHADKPLEHGLEPTPEEWCTRLVSVFREARRVLRSDGVCWIEVGDSYNQPGSHAGRNDRDSLVAYDVARGFVKDAATSEQERPDRGKPRPRLDTMKPKDLVGAPWLLAFALRADGWYLRSDTIWARPNPMPESVTDRPTKAHSYLFLMTKSARYFYDADAIREAHTGWEQRGDGTWKNLNGGPAIGNRAAVDRPGVEVLSGNMAPGKEITPHPAGRNARSVWSIPTEPTPFAHFATFPTALVERCIKAGTSEHGCCSECGAPWRRITEQATNVHPGDSGRNDVQGTAQRGKREDGKAIGTIMRERHEAGRGRSTTGWEASCAHDAPIVPCRVLDPFMGSGTTALVARRLGRHAIGIELNASYLEIAANRLQQLSLFSTEAQSGPTTANKQESP